MSGIADDGQFLGDEKMDTAPKNQRSLLWNAPLSLTRQPKPGEQLFECVRASDRAPMPCELRFHGESWGY